MFGSEYASYPEIIMGDFGKMTKQYKKRSKIPSNSFIKQIYRLYLKIFGIPEIGFQLRILYFQKFLKNNFIRPRSILDAGCGIGFYTLSLHKRFPNATITGCDIEADKIRFCKQLMRDQHIKNVQYSVFDLEKQTLRKNFYDLIINIDVLEHIQYYKKTIRNFHQALKTNGFLYIHTPQTNQKRFFKSLTNWSHETHAREGFVTAEFADMLIQSGFKIIFLKNTFGFFGSLAWELNHLFLNKSFFLVGIAYPFLYFLARLDVLRQNKKGLGMSVLLQKK